MPGRQKIAMKGKMYTEKFHEGKNDENSRGILTHNPYGPYLKEKNLASRGFELESGHKKSRMDYFLYDITSLICLRMLYRG